MLERKGSIAPVRQRGPVGTIDCVSEGNDDRYSLLDAVYVFPTKSGGRYGLHVLPAGECYPGAALFVGKRIWRSPHTSWYGTIVVIWHRACRWPQSRGLVSCVCFCADNCLLICLYIPLSCTCTLYTIALFLLAYAAKTKVETQPDILAVASVLVSLLRQYTWLRRTIPRSLVIIPASDGPSAGSSVGSQKARHIQPPQHPLITTVTTMTTKQAACSCGAVHISFSGTMPNVSFTSSRRQPSPNTSTRSQPPAFFLPKP
jgi:hypothetical protein